MAFWNSEILRLRLPGEKIVEPYLPARVKHAGYELSLGGDAYVTSAPDRKKVQLQPGDHLDIPPGQFALLHTAERISLPTDTIAFISIKAGIKLRGLVNISGFHVDPGFSGQLVFSVYNAGSRSIKISCADPVFLIWFSELTGPTTDAYAGIHRGQQGIGANAVMEIEGDIASPAVLVERIRKVERSLRSQKKWFWSFVIPLALGIITLFAAFLWEHVTNPPSAKPSSHVQP